MAPSGQVLLPTEGTDVNAHPTGPDSGDLISQIVSILFAAVDVKAGLARFLRIEGAARKSPRRTGFDAELAIGTPVGERPARFKRGVSQGGWLLGPTIILGVRRVVIFYSRRHKS